MNYMMQGGPLIWLVLILGIAALLPALKYATTQRGRDASVAVGTAIASAIVALLATVIGFQKSVGGLREVAVDDRWIYLWGLKESLNNVVVTLVFALLVALLLMVGSLRGRHLGGAG